MITINDSRFADCLATPLSYRTDADLSARDTLAVNLAILARHFTGADFDIPQTDEDMADLSQMLYNFSRASYIPNGTLTEVIERTNLQRHSLR